MKLSQLIIPLFLIALIFTTSCSKDDESGPSYEFKDQNLQGMIDGEAFVFGEGTFSVSNNQISIELLSDMETESACDIFGFGDHVSAFFTIQNEVGLVELSLDLNSFEDSQTVTLFNPETTLNIIASEGAVEITSITETTVSGKIDARSDDDYINGNFTVSVCE